MNKIYCFTMLSIAILSGCTSKSDLDQQIDSALKICGSGISTKTAEAYKAAFNKADNNGELSFTKSATQEVETQKGILLKQGNLKSDASFRLAVEQMNGTSDCVIREMNMLRPPSKAELLEQCRQNIQHKWSPDQNIKHGELRYWNTQNINNKNVDIVTMSGLFDTGGSSSIALLVECDISNDRFNNATVIDSK